MDSAGKIKNAFKSTDIDKWANILKRVKPITVRSNESFGVSEDHFMYNWFMRDVFSNIQKHFDVKLNLMFGMYLNEREPWQIHTDAYHTANYENRHPAYSMLIPLSVDDDKSLVSRSRTIIFNEKVLSNKTILDLPILDKNALDIYQQHLSHNSIEVVKRCSVLSEFQWEEESLIYWESTMLHDSDNFKANGFSSKQAIVIHTYY